MDRLGVVSELWKMSYLAWRPNLRPARPPYAGSHDGALTSHLCLSMRFKAVIWRGKWMRSCRRRRFCRIDGLVKYCEGIKLRYRK